MIELEQRGAVMVLRMARGKGNSLNVEFIKALVDALADLEKGPARAVVITGQGSVFGAGVDLNAMIQGGADYVQKFVTNMTQFFERLVMFSKPLVAAVNGHAIAGGAIILLACDQRLLARGNARVGLSEILVGVQFPAWALEIARFAIPPGHFQTTVMTGRTFLPDEALARGLVDELVDADKLLDRACQVAEEMLVAPAENFTATKLAVRRTLIDAGRTQSALTDADVLADWCSAKTLSHVAAFVERTMKK